MAASMNLAGDLLESEQQLVVLCSICNNLLGIPTDPIQEVLAIPEVRPVHHAPPYVRGVFNLRGRVIVLIDPAVKLELEPQSLSGESRILVLQSGEELIGILVSALLGILPFSYDQLTPKPENLSGAFRRAVSGFLFLDNKMVGLLKIDDLLEQSGEAVLLKEAGK